MDKTQSELNGVYLRYLNTLTRNNKTLEYLNGDQIESPLLINSGVENGNYFKSDIKVLYVGKENNGWYGKDQRFKTGMSEVTDTNNYLEDLLNGYLVFNLGKKYRTSIFTFLDLLRGKAEEASLDMGVLWSNLLRIDCGKNFLLKNETFDLDNNQTLIDEIEILRPDVVLFVTGPNYDYFLEKTFKGISKETEGVGNEREFCLLKHDALPLKSFRVYHPNYHSILGGGYRYELAERIIKIIKQQV